MIKYTYKETNSNNILAGVSLGYKLSRLDFRRSKFKLIPSGKFQAKLK